MFHIAQRCYKYSKKIDQTKEEKWCKTLNEKRKVAAFGNNNYIESRILKFIKFCADHGVIHSSELSPGVSVKLILKNILV